MAGKEEKAVYLEKTYPGAREAFSIGEVWEIGELKPVPIL
jgi:hypothetical protein